MGPGTSPISSRKTVPVSACSNLPGLVVLAPVKAPFSYPNNSLSIRFSGMAVQLIFTSSRVIPMSGDQIRLALAVFFGSATAVAVILMLGLAGWLDGVLYSPLEFKLSCQATGAVAVNRTGWEAVTVARGGLIRSSAGLQLGQSTCHCQRMTSSRIAAQTTQ